MNLSGDPGALLFQDCLQVRGEIAQLLTRVLQLFFRPLSLGDVDKGDHGAGERAALWIPHRNSAENPPRGPTVGTADAEGHTRLGFSGRQTFGDGIVFRLTRSAVLPDRLRVEIDDI